MVHTGGIAKRALWVIRICWLGAAAGGLAMMADFANRPGATAQPPTRWPAGVA